MKDECEIAIDVVIQNRITTFKEHNKLREIQCLKKLKRLDSKYLSHSTQLYIGPPDFKHKGEVAKVSVTTLSDKADMEVV